MRVLLVTLITCAFALSANAQYSGGTGEPNDPYRIATAADLIALGESPEDYDKHFILTADIDLDPDLPGGRVFDRAVIAPDSDPCDLDWGGGPLFTGTYFTGVFDGDGHTISHLTIEGRDFLGLFGQLAMGGEVRDVGLVAVSVTGLGDDIGCSRVGGLVGLNSGRVIRCYSTGTVSGGEAVGGLVGWNTVAGRGRSPGRINESCSTCGVIGGTFVGGLVGNHVGALTDCYSTGPVQGGEVVGGLVGYNSGTVTRCYSTSAVSGADYVGGLVGDGFPAAVVLSVWDVETSGVSGSVGGVGLTTVEMMDPEMLGLNGFDNDPNWILDAGLDYPALAWQGKPGDIIAEPDIDWLAGLGTAEDPYRIDTADQLILLGRASILWDRHLILGTDLDLAPNLPNAQVFGQAVIPTFSGIFDGDSRTISHLTIDGASYLGLFGVLTWEAEVRGLGIVDANIVGSGYCVAGLAGSNDGTVTQCHSTGVVTGNGWAVGGLFGSSAGTVTQCFSTCTIRGGSSVGGLVGNNDGTLTDCYGTGAVTGDGSVGGLVGSHYGVMTHCYSTGEVVGDPNLYVGGLVGQNYASERWPLVGVIACFWDIETSGQTESAGGTGQITVEMQRAETFFEWGICDGKGVWTIDDGHDYPRLWWEGRPGQPIAIDLSDLVEGDGTPEHPYLIYTLEEINLIAMFPCEQDKHFRLMFVSGQGTPEDPYVIRSADDLDLLALCPYEQDKQFRLGFLPGTGTPDDPYVIRTTDDLDLLARCPYEQEKHFRLGFLAGKGTQDDPYLVATADQLDLMGTCPYERKAHFLLMTDIDLSSFDGKDGRLAFHIIDSFGGLFDGNGHTVSNLAITGITNVGLFGQLTSEAEVRDLGVVDVNVIGSNSSAGGLTAWNAGRVIRCYSTGIVSGRECVGGLLGANSGTVIQCYSSGSVSGSWSVGGLIGSNHGAVTFCYSTTSVTGAATAGLSVGGLAGWDSGTLTQCYSAGRVYGRDGYVGGLVGCGGWSLVQCFWDIQTSGQTGNADAAGKTTAEMRSAGTFLDAGWDFVDEAANGMEDIWRIDAGHDYPRLVWEPCSPQNGAKDLSRSPMLRWQPSGPGLQYDVYVGDDEAAVAAATLVSEGIYCGRRPAEVAVYQPGSLVWGKTYYWRIDEVDEADPASIWKGRVRSFTVTDAIVSRTPEDGAADVVYSPVLSWKTGEPGLQYDVYLGETAESVANATMASEGIYCGRQTAGMTTYTPLPLTRGETYHWRIDAVDKVDPGSVWKGSVWSFTITDACMTPDPADGATDVIRSQVLRWVPSEPGLQYDVYLGETEDVVTNATVNSEGIYRGRQTSDVTMCTPSELEWGKTYYWRIDEVDAANEIVCKGQTWSFTVETYGCAIKPIRATASSSNNDQAGPEKTIDGSGLNALDEHSTSSSHMWLSGYEVLPPAWIQYQFDRVYTLDQMWVWNSNMVFEFILGFGAKDVTVEYSLDGVDWTALGQVQFAQATSTPRYTANTVVDLGGVQAQFVRLTITSNWGRLIPQYSLGEIRFFYVPLEAYGPQRTSGTTGVAPDGVLSWRPGRRAVTHHVYVSADKQAVVNETAPLQTVTESHLNLTPLALEYGATYYWKVNEISDGETPSIWEGDVWSFSTVISDAGL